MARQVSIPYEFTTPVTSFDETNSSYYQQASGYPDSNGLGDGTGTYAGFHLTRGSGAITNVYYNFDCSSIPDDATITSVTCSERASMSTATTNYVSQATLQLCAGTTTKGSATSILKTTAQYFTIDGGTNWSVAEIKNCKLKGYAKRGSRNTSSQYTMRLFGGVLTVEYTVQGMAYTVTASSSIDGDTLTPATQELYANRNATVKIIASDITDKVLIDNGSTVTSALAYMPPDTGGTLERYPADTDIGGSGTISGMRYITTIGHGVDNPSDTTTMDATAIGGTTAIIYYLFDFSDLPDSATISSMTVQVRYEVNNTSYTQSVNTYNNTTAKGTAVTLTSTSPTTVTITSPGTWTAAELKDDPRIGVTISYSGLIVTGITWTVTYVANEPAYYKYTINKLATDHTLSWTLAASNKFYIKQNNSWIEVNKIYLKSNGSWVEQSLDYLSTNNINQLSPGN